MFLSIINFASSASRSPSSVILSYLYLHRRVFQITTKPKLITRCPIQRVLCLAALLRRLIIYRIARILDWSFSFYLSCLLSVPSMYSHLLLHISLSKWLIVFALDRCSFLNIFRGKIFYQYKLDASLQHILRICYQSLCRATIDICHPFVTRKSLKHYAGHYHATILKHSVLQLKFLQKFCPRYTDPTR
jgi:hypothetical protein